MKYIFTIAIALIAIVTLVSVQYTRDNPTTALLPFKPPPPGKILSEPTLRLPVRTQEQQPVEWTQELATTMLYDPFSRARPNNSEIAAYDALHVIPWNKIVGQHCEEKSLVDDMDNQEDRDALIAALAEHGLSDVQRKCGPVFQRHRHQYRELPIAELEALAETDAVAAFLMMEDGRLNHDNLGWSLRSAALSEKTGPLLKFAIGISLTDGTMGGETERVDEVINALVAVRVAQKLGDPRANPQAYLDILDSFSTVPDDWETRVEHNVTQALKTMTDIQRDITGSVQVWEMTNA